MASKEINDLTAKSSLVGTDELILQETGGGATKKVTLDNFYEAGSFTPTYNASVGDVGTWTSYSGVSMRIGNMVTIIITITGTGMGFNDLNGYHVMNPGIALAPSQNSSGSFASTTISAGLAGAFVLTTSNLLYLYAPHNATATGGLISATLTYRRTT